MITESEKFIIKKTLSPINPTLIGIFGSYARSEANEDSDLDILVDVNEKVNLLDIIGFEQELSDNLHKKIDLVTMRSLNNKVKPYIMKDLIIL